MTTRNTDIDKLVYRVVDLSRKRETEFPVSEIDKAWHDCELRIKRASSRKAMRRTIAICSGAVAAAVTLMLWWGATGIIVTQGSTGRQDITAYAINTDVGMADGHIVNIVPGCDTAVIAQNSARFSCLPSGKVLVNGKPASDAVVNPVGNEFCQLVVPKGRRAEMRFADGTHLWANSNSRVVYPQKFSEDTREIYVSGEVYLDVAPDKKHPFIVYSKDFNVTVLGTSFNIMAYDNGFPSQVVLVSGKVELSNSANEKVTMNPGELVDIAGSNMSISRHVDVASYVSWKDNMLIYSDKTLTDVFSRLNSCYGREFVLSPDVADIKVTGKLYLKDSIKDVLHAIAFSAPVTYEVREDTIYVCRQNREKDAPCAIPQPYE